MRTTQAIAACVLLCFSAPGCIPILIHGQMQAEATRKAEWERQNFEREKAGMPLLTYEEWTKREKALEVDKK